MRSDEGHSVYLGHLEFRQVDWPSAGRPRDARPGGERRLLGVERIEARAAGVSEQHDLLEAALAQERKAGGDIEKRDLVLESQVVAHRARRLRPCREAGFDNVR